MIRAVSGAAGLRGPAAFVFFGRLVALGTGILTALLASRVLGADGRGVVVTFAAVQFLLATGLALGTGSAAYLLTSRRDLPVPAIVGGVMLVGGAIGIASAVVAGAAIATGINRQLLPDVADAVALLIAPAAASQYVATTMVQMAMGSARPKTTMVALALSPVLLLVATASVAAVGGGAGEMIAAYTIAWAVAAGIAGIVVSRSVSMRLATARRLVVVGSPAALGDLANALSYRSDVLVLSLLAGPAAVGVYALAVQALEPLWILAGSAAGGLLISLPSQPQQTWKPTVVGATLRISALTLVGAIAVVALMPIMVTAAGPGFEAAPIVALAIAPAIVLLAASKTLSVVQLVSGRLGWSTLISGASLALNLAANVALIPLLGAVGAGLASVVSYGSSAALWTWALRRR